MADSDAPSEGDPYRGQSRGTGAAYERYLAGMDASMRQKVALTAAHLLSEGLVADMGMGSGATSKALAALYPALNVVGVDVNPEMVARATAKHTPGSPNLRFIEGDIAKLCFPEGELDAIVNSSVLHHVTTFNGYDPQAAVEAMSVQTEQLAPDGILVVRDFVRPPDDGAWVTLEVSKEDGRQLERFSREFRPLSEAPGFELRDAGVAEDGWRRFELTRRHAVEFVLRKDYRRDWDIEVLEEYTYLDQSQFEGTFAELGLRVLASTPLHNPWIVRHRFEGHFRWFARDGTALDWPATNYVIVGQKVAPFQGVRFEGVQSCHPQGYLSLSHWRRDDGAVFDLVRRPGRTADIVPWFVSPATGSIHVLARRSYPRPLMALATGPFPDGAKAPHYVTEPLTILVDDKPLAQAAEERLREFPTLTADHLVRFEEGAPFYPSPGGLQEVVRPLFIEVKPTGHQSSLRHPEPWSSWGSVRAMEGRQLLRAAQVGGLPDARLESHVYDLLLRQNQSVGPWIGATLDIIGTLPAEPSGRIRKDRLRRRFRQDDDGAGFLELGRARFREVAADDQTLAEGELEYVVPRPVSAVTVTLAMVASGPDGVPHLALDDDDLPAAQCFTGHSDLWVLPAWRCPEGPDGWTALEGLVRSRSMDEYGMRVAELCPLGGRYFPSPGCTPEVVYPMLATVSELRVVASHTRDVRELRWVPLGELLTHRHSLPDGHLRIALLRAAHALGLLDEYPA